MYRARCAGFGSLKKGRRREGGQAKRKLSCIDQSRPCAVEAVASYFEEEFARAETNFDSANNGRVRWDNVR